MAVMRAGTTARAADMLRMSQPAVSRALADLERTIGFALFDRIRNRLVPTPEGKLFLADVEAYFKGLDTLRAGAARIRDQGAGVLRIASLSAFGSSLVPRAIRRFHDMHPDIRVTLQVLPSRYVRDAIASGQYDIGLAADEVDTTGVNHQPFTSANALCAIPRGWPLEAQREIAPADLAGVPIIAYVPEDRGRQRMERAFADAGIAPRIVVETLYASTVCALVAEGLGVGFVTSYSVGGMDMSRVVLRPFTAPVAIRSLLLLPQDRPKSNLVRDMIDCLMALR